MIFDDGDFDIGRRHFGRAIRREMAPASVPHEAKAAEPPLPCPYIGPEAATIAEVMEAEERRAAWRKTPVVCLVPRDDPAKPKASPRRYRYGPTPEL